MQDFILSGHLLADLRILPTKLRIDIAVYLYDSEQRSMGQAKKLAGLTQIEFQQEMSKRGVCIKYDVEDSKQDLDTLKQFI